MSADDQMPSPSAMSPGRTCLSDLSPRQIESTINELPGARRYYGAVVRRWLYRRLVDRFESMTDLPRPFRQALAERFRLRRAELRQVDEAPEGTTLLGLRLDDGAWIESVLIPDAARTTLCVSSQVGCPVRCVFCASGRRGLRRQLTPGEILDQILVARARLTRPEDLTNLVFMGIGEPLLNFANLSVALDSLCSPSGMGISPRRLTISTVGWPDRIDRLAALGRPYNLAISLHAADPELRARLIPHGGRLPLADILAAGRRYQEATGRETTFEVVLIAGLNDSIRQARQIADLLRGYPCTVNLIPLNPVRETPYRPPTPGRRVSFRRALETGGLKVTTRTPRGRGIDAACGQLRLDREGTSPPRD